MYRMNDKINYISVLNGASKWQLYKILQRKIVTIEVTMHGGQTAEPRNSYTY